MSEQITPEPDSSSASDSSSSTGSHQTSVFEATSQLSSPVTVGSVLNALTFVIFPWKHAYNKRKAEIKALVDDLLHDPLPRSRVTCGDDRCLLGLQLWVDAYSYRLKEVQKRTRKYPKSDIIHVAREMDVDVSDLPTTNQVDRVRYQGSYHIGVSLLHVLLRRQWMKRRNAQIRMPAHLNYINLVLSWKGYPTESFKVLARCACDVDRDNAFGTFITRETLAAVIAVYYLHIFTTYQPTEESKYGDMSLPENFSRLRLLCVWSTDSGTTWHAHVGYVTHERITVPESMMYKHKPILIIF